MEPDGKTYLVPHPALARAIMALVGIFAITITPHELWRGVWPLNATTPFFGALVLAGMTLGWSLLYSGLFAPAICLRFSPGVVDVTYKYPWGRSQASISAEGIEAFQVEESPSADGPSCWHAVLKLKNGPSIYSRPLSTRVAAERLLGEFQTAISRDET